MEPNLSVWPKSCPLKTSCFALKLFLLMSGILKSCLGRTCLKFCLMLSVHFTKETVNNKEKYRGGKALLEWCMCLPHRLRWCFPRRMLIPNHPLVNVKYRSFLYASHHSIKCLLKIMPPNIQHRKKFCKKNVLKTPHSTAILTLTKKYMFLTLKLYSWTCSLFFSYFPALLGVWLAHKHGVELRLQRGHTYALWVRLPASSLTPPHPGLTLQGVGCAAWTLKVDSPGQFQAYNTKVGATVTRVCVPSRDIFILYHKLCTFWPMSPFGPPWPWAATTLPVPVGLTLSDSICKCSHLVCPCLGSDLLRWRCDVLLGKHHLPCSCSSCWGTAADLGWNPTYT